MVSHRLRLAVSALCLASLAACGDGGTSGGSGAGPEPPPPVEERSPQARHLLLITIDTLRADALGTYGGREGVSPAIDGLAAEGTLFEEVHAPSSMTLPSMTSLFTSKHPAETGVLKNRHLVADEEYTLAERLAAEGFRTRGLTASWILRPEGAGFEQGFDSYQLIEDEEALTVQAEEALRGDFGQEARREFLWLHYLDPHQPFDAREPYASQFTADYQGPYREEWPDLDAVYEDKVELAAEDVAYIRAVYHSQVRLLDDRVGRVLAALEESGAAADTLVVLAADHGEELYDHDFYFFHMLSLHGSVTHVPLVVRQPGVIPAGRRVAGVVELLDVLPTVLSHLGVDPLGEDPLQPGQDARLRGEDLGPTWSGQRLEKVFAYAQRDENHFAVRNQDWLLLVSTAREPAGGNRRRPPAGRRVRLFDLKTDPGEQEDVAAANPEVVRRMERIWNRWRSQLESRTSPMMELDEETRRHLQALGYLEGGDDH